MVRAPVRLLPHSPPGTRRRPCLPCARLVCDRRPSAHATPDACQIKDSDGADPACLPAPLCSSTEHGVHSRTNTRAQTTPRAPARAPHHGRRAAADEQKPSQGTGPRHARGGAPAWRSHSWWAPRRRRRSAAAPPPAPSCARRTPLSPRPGSSRSWRADRQGLGGGCGIAAQPLLCLLRHALAEHAVAAASKQSSWRATLRVCMGCMVEFRRAGGHGAP